MKKSIKKLIFSLVMAVGLALGTAAVCSFADYTETVGDITYTYRVSNNEAEIRNVSPKSIGNCTIPSTLGGNSVRIIGFESFENCSDLRSVILPNTITQINSYAFKGCNSLNYNEYDTGYYLGTAENLYYALIKAKSEDITSCQINSDTKVIAGDAFEHCSNLTSITIPEGVVTIGNYAFGECTNLTSVTIPSSVTKIATQAFEYCNNLISITISEGVAKIGDSAFFDCVGLTSVTIPSTVTSMDDYVFGNCSNLTNVFVKDGQSLGGDPFWKDDQDINVWRYVVNKTVAESIDGKTHVTITSVEDKDGNPSSISASLACDAMGENYVIDSVSCCATGNATDGWTVYGTHTLIKTDAVEPTCTTEGNEEYYTCDRCGKYFSDENA